ncbi:MAG: OB-fold nucleic acid binding domain-containing protein [Candidatus Helarchaeota archaeon]
MAFNTAFGRNPDIPYTAYKLYVKDIKDGDILRTSEERTYFQTRFNLKTFRVRLLGTIIYHQIFAGDENAGRKESVYVTIDDGTEQIRLKTWDPVLLEKMKSLKKGQVIDVIGTVREYNDEVYINPLMIFPINDLKYELLRDLDIINFRKTFKQRPAEKRRAPQPTSTQTSESAPMKPSSSPADEDSRDDEIQIILGLIEELDKGEGVKISQIEEKSSLSEKDIKNHIQYLYENGYIYEPSLDRYKIL